MTGLSEDARDIARAVMGQDGRSPEQQQAWTSGMLTQIARDLELIKARLGIITDAEGDTRYVPGSLLPREQDER